MTTALLLLLFCTAPVSAIDQSELFPFGREVGDFKLDPGDDASTDAVKLERPVTFYKVLHESIYINVNGFLSFLTDVPHYQAERIPLPGNIAAIFVFYADIDTRAAGDVYFGQSENPASLARVNSLVHKSFPDGANYSASHLITATWQRVGCYDRLSDEVNSFQVAIACDANQECYAILLYVDGQIQWLRGEGKFDDETEGEDIFRDIYPQAGFQSDSGDFYHVPPSGSEAMEEIDLLTNAHAPGLFLYRISGMVVKDPREVGNDYEYYESDDYNYNDPEIVCALHEVFDSCGVKCPAICGDLPRDCSGECLAGCFCGEGYIRESADGACISYVECTDRQLDANEAELKQKSAGDRSEPEPVSETEPEPASETEPISEPVAPTDSSCPIHEGPCTASNGCSLLPNDEGCLVCVCDKETTPVQVVEGLIPPPTVPTRPNPAMRCDPTVSHTCHSHAHCIEETMCCACDAGYFGNGKQCLKEGEAHRMSGALSGSVNGVPITESDVHSYALSSDGRAYVALSRIPQSVGHSMLLLNTLGSVIGWMFAKPGAGSAQNGFAITGGIFNRSATVHINDRYTVTIQQEITGKDKFDYLNVQLFVTGDLPTVPADAEVHFDSFREDYRRVAPGVLKSYAQRRATVTDSQRNTLATHELAIDQTIRYDECSGARGIFAISQLNPVKEKYRFQLNAIYAPPHLTSKGPGMVEPDVISLLSERSFVLVEPSGNGHIVRYAAQYTVGPPPQNLDPCSLPEANECSKPHMTCAPHNDRHRCVCLPGYEIRAGPYTQDCVDINECETSRHSCDTNADCFNVDGTFTCTCKRGFRGTGQKCVRSMNHCEDMVCDRNARCEVTPDGQGAKCICGEGYYGDGYSCRRVIDQAAVAPGSGGGGFACSAHSDCDRTGGICEFSTAAQRYQCACRPGFDGDGKICTRRQDTCDVVNTCDVNADCVLEESGTGPAYVCRCRPTYTGNGYHCTKLALPTGDIQCNVLNNCHANARCVFDAQRNTHSCVCLNGFSGDGYQCRAEERDVVQLPSTSPVGHPCQSPADCHQNGYCVLDTTTQRYVCECLPGYRGDGRNECSAADECNPRSSQCTANAQCAFDEQARGYVCHCKAGYSRIPGTTGVTTQCQAGYVPQPAVPPVYEPVRPHYPPPSRRPVSEPEELLFAQGMAVMSRKTNNDSAVRQVVMRPRQLVAAVAFDCEQRRIYWSDIRRHRIMSCDMQGRNVKTVISGDGIDSPEGLAIDHASRLLYWTDSGTDTISVASLDGKHRRVLLTGDGLVNPRAIVVDVVNGYIYWSDWHRSHPHIGRARTDGSQRTVFIEDGVQLPNGLALLPHQRELCWIDAGDQRLACARLDRPSQRRVVRAPLGYPFGLTLVNDADFYWTDWDDKRIHTAPVYGSNVESTLKPSVGASGKLYGIATATRECPFVETACSRSNGGCRHLCLPLGADPSHRTCACPDNVAVEECEGVHRDYRAAVRRNRLH